MRVHIVVAAALALVSGCSSVRKIVYGPMPQTGRPDAPDQIDGHAAVTYAVPAGGEVELAVRRLTTLRVPNGPTGRNAHVVVVRMIMHNRGDDIWSVNCGAIDSVIDGAEHQYPIRAEWNGKPLWITVLRPGESRTIDLYYELPSDTPKPRIAVRWRAVRTNGTVLRATATLARGDAPRSSGAQATGK